MKQNKIQQAAIWIVFGILASFFAVSLPTLSVVPLSVTPFCPVEMVCSSQLSTQGIFLFTTITIVLALGVIMAIYGSMKLWKVKIK